MPLTMAEIGKVSVINRVNGNEETRRFLGNLGFVLRILASPSAARSAS